MLKAISNCFVSGSRPCAVISTGGSRWDTNTHLVRAMGVGSSWLHAWSSCIQHTSLPWGANQCRMEVDWSATDECKEGDDGALLRASEHGDGDSTDFSLQPPHGQMQISG